MILYKDPDEFMSNEDMANLQLHLVTASYMYAHQQTTTDAIRYLLKAIEERFVRIYSFLFLGSSNNLFFSLFFFSLNMGICILYLCNVM